MADYFCIKCKERCDVKSNLLSDCCNSELLSATQHFIDFYNAWWYLVDDFEEGLDLEISKTFQYYDEKEDMYMSYFTNGLLINAMKVNPETKCVDEDNGLNTKTEVWLECGEPYLDENCNTIRNYHNIEYDTGGDTFEEAIINLANLIWTKENVLHA